MAKAGKKHTLLLYTRMMDRWWPPVFLIGLSLAALAWWLYQDVYARITQPWQWMTLAAAAAVCGFASFIMLVLRKSAYVRPYGDHLLLATPLLRMNISYRRIRRTASASMAMLFPPSKLSLLKHDTLSPLLKRTAVVVELNALPMPRSTLRLFLSPFFFKDDTPHIVLLVPDWMAFSTELESMRVSGASEAPTVRRTDSSLLSQLPKR